MKDTEYYKHQARFSKAAELYVRAKLLLLGFYPASFDTDDGCDIILDNGLRFQVKSALVSSSSGAPSYTFALKMGHEGKRINTKKFDYLALVGFKDEKSIEDVDFFIIPSTELTTKYTLRIPANYSNSKYRLFQGYHFNSKSGGDK